MNDNIANQVSAILDQAITQNNELLRKSIKKYIYIILLVCFPFLSIAITYNYQVVQALEIARADLIRKTIDIENLKSEILSQTILKTETINEKSKNLRSELMISEEYDIFPVHGLHEVISSKSYDLIIQQDDIYHFNNVRRFYLNGIKSSKNNISKIEEFLMSGDIFVVISPRFVNSGEIRAIDIIVGRKSLLEFIQSSRI